MKKIILMSVLTLSILSYSISSSASKLLGVEVTYIKGTKEWNATKTAVECIGKGVCEFTIKGGIGLAYQSGGDGIGTLGFTEDGKFGLLVPTDVASDPYWKETFSNGTLYIGKDITISNDIKSKLKNCPQYIKAGNYKYKVDKNSILVMF